MYKTKTVAINLGKKDVREIPFQELWDIASNTFKFELSKLEEEALEQYENEVSRVTQTLMRIKQSSEEGCEEGSDGFEAAAREAVEFREVSEEVKKELRAKVYKACCAEFSSKYTLVARAAWLPAQLMSLISKWKAVKVGDKYNAKATLQASVDKQDSWMLGVWVFITYAKRGDFVKDQYKPSGINYSALVPFILAGFKQYHGIKYSEWDTQDLEYLVEPELLEAMLYTDYPEYPTAELIAVRDHCLTTQGGRNPGELRSPVSSAILYHTTDTILTNIPKLGRIMLTQVWCAHPSNRVHSKLLVLDPKNWDSTPAPLIETSMLRPTVKTPGRKIVSVVDDGIPW